MVFLFITLTARNLFLNIFKAKHLLAPLKPVTFLSLNASFPKTKSKNNKESIDDLAYSAEIYLNTKFLNYAYIIFIFQRISNRFKKRRQKHTGLLQRCRFFMKRFENISRPLICILDNNPLAFNGCKTTRVRRKKRRLCFKRERFDVKYEKNK